MVQTLTLFGKSRYLLDDPRIYFFQRNPLNEPLDLRRSS